MLRERALSGSSSSLLVVCTQLILPLLSTNNGVNPPGGYTYMYMYMYPENGGVHVRTKWVNCQDCDSLCVVTWWERKWWAKHQGEQVGNLECSVNFTVNQPTLSCTWMNAHLKVNKSTRNQTKAVQGSQSLFLSLSLSLSLIPSLWSVHPSPPSMSVSPFAVAAPHCQCHLSYYLLRAFWWLAAGLGLCRKGLCSLPWIAPADYDNLGGRSASSRAPVSDLRSFARAISKICIP